MLQDTFGRHFHYLRLSVTDMCNFRCNYCLPDGIDCDQSKDYLTLNEIKTLVAAFAHMGTSKIRITGGEPALRKDLTEIIHICQQTPGIEQIALTTNGFNLDRKIKDFVAAGLTAVNVSADSLDPRMFADITGKNMLERVMCGVDAAIATGLTKVKLNTVLLRQYNTQEFDLFLSYLKNHPVTWRFIELMQTGDNANFFSRNHVAGETLRQQLVADGWERIVRDKQAGPALEYRHEDYQGQVGLIMPYSKDFCQSCNRLRVSSHGNVHLCLFAEQGFSIRPYLQQGDIQATCDAVQTLMKAKLASHSLQQGFTGATRQLAMLGG
ncbi:GTP 3',8-cyclase MoaA [Neptunicella sp.]|uniref:GTP 3',8-cyclase MoaA n=1 Tax=Neptunicella sp. TaxID=2125986 RepID=UPI003F68D326